MQGASVIPFEVFFVLELVIDLSREGLGHDVRMLREVGQ